MASKPLEVISAACQMLISDSTVKAAALHLKKEPRA